MIMSDQRITHQDILDKDEISDEIFVKYIQQNYPGWLELKSYLFLNGLENEVSMPFLVRGTGSLEDIKYWIHQFRRRSEEEENLQGFEDPRRNDHNDITLWVCHTAGVSHPIHKFAEGTLVDPFCLKIDKKAQHLPAERSPCLQDIRTGNYALTNSGDSAEAILEITLANSTVQGEQEDMEVELSQVDDFFPLKSISQLEVATPIMSQSNGVVRFQQTPEKKQQVLFNRGNVGRAEVVLNQNHVEFVNGHESSPPRASHPKLVAKDRGPNLMTNETSGLFGVSQNSSQKSSSQVIPQEFGSQQGASQDIQFSSQSSVGEGSQASSAVGDLEDFDEEKLKGIDWDHIDMEEFPKRMREVADAFEQKCNDFVVWLNSDPAKRIWPSTDKRTKDRFRLQVKHYYLEHGVLYRNVRLRRSNEGEYKFTIN